VFFAGIDLIIHLRRKHYLYQHPELADGNFQFERCFYLAYLYMRLQKGGVIQLKLFY